MAAPDRQYPRVDVAIVTALQSELNPVLDLIGGKEAWEKHPVRGITHYVAQWGDEKQSVHVVAATAGKQGKDFINAAVARVLAFRPRLVVMVGYCAGRAERSWLGDVIVSDVSFDTLEGKDTTGDFKPDGERGQSMSRKPSGWADEFSQEYSWDGKLKTPRPEYVLAQMLCRLLRGDIPYLDTLPNEQEEEARLALDWLNQEKYIKRNRELTVKGKQWIEARSSVNGAQRQPLPVLRTPRIHVAPAVQWIAVEAGPGSYDDAVKQMRKVLMGDQESLSFLRATREHEVVGLVVKGVVDHADGKKHDIFHRYSKEAAARWLYDYLITHADLIQGLPTTFGSDEIASHRDLLPPDTRLPPHYIERTELLAEGRAALLGADRVVPLIALHGMGGIGKTVLARALCEDEQVRAAFPDGILWRTLSQKPDLAQLLQPLIEHLGGTVRENVPTLEGLSAELVNLLRERRCLLVLDDVWKPSHAEPFLSGGPGCRVLITTRDAEIAHAVGAPIHRVDLLLEREAITLLEAWAVGSLSEVSYQLKREIVRELGQLPLAIRLAGSDLRRRQPSRWLHDFRARKIKLREQRTDKNKPRPHDDLEVALALSIDALTEEDDTAEQRYIQLAIFKEDEPIPLSAAARLWLGPPTGDDIEADLLLKDLAARSLLDYDPVTQCATIHDLLRKLIGDRLGGAGHIAAHAALLDAYVATQKEPGHWYTAPDDRYLYDHLAYHLAGAKRWPELRGLFTDDAWMHVRVSQNDWRYDGYLVDLEIAWCCAEAEARKQIGADEAPAALADCVRYALIRSSVNSLATNYEPTLVGQAVAIGLWSAQRALSITKKVVDPQLRAEMGIMLLKVRAEDAALVAKLQQVRADLQNVTLSAVLAIENLLDRSKALAAFAPQLDGQPTLLAQALDAALAIDEDDWRNEALATLAPGLAGRPALLAQVLTVAESIQNEWSRSSVLADIAPGLASQPALLDQALAAALAIKSEEPRSQALATLVPQLAEPERHTTLAHALTAALAIADEQARSKALATLAPSLAGRPALLAHALTVVQAIRYERARSRGLAYLAPFLEGQTALLTQATAVASAIQDEWSRSRAFAALAPQLAEPERQTALAQALTAALAIKDEGSFSSVLTWPESRSCTLATLAPQLEGHPELLSQALTAARSIRNERSRSFTLAALAQRLTEPGRQGALTQALVAAQAIEDEWSRSHALADLAPQLAKPEQETVLAQALAAAQAIEYEGYNGEGLNFGGGRGKALADLGPQLAHRPALLAQALIAAQAIEGERPRSFTLAVLGQWLMEPERQAILAQALAAARDIAHERSQHEALLHLAPQLTNQPALLTQILAIAQSIKNDRACSQVLVALAPSLASQPALLVQAYTVALAIQDKTARNKALAALVPKFASWPALLSRTLASAQVIKDEPRRSEVLHTLVGWLANQPTLLAQMHIAVQSVEEGWVQRAAFQILALQLEEQPALLAQAQSAALAIEDESWQSYALAILAMELGRQPTLLAQALTTAQTIKKEFWRSYALAALAPQLAEPARQDAIAHALTAVFEIEDDWSRNEALAYLAPQLAAQPALLAQALTAVFEIEDDWSRNEALAYLAPQLATQPALLAQALTTAQKIKDEWSRSQTLAALAPLLAEPERQVAIAQALTAARVIKDERWRSQALAALAPQLAEPERQVTIVQALGAAQTSWDTQLMGRVLATLVPLLAEPEWQAAFAHILAIEDEGRRSWALVALAQQQAGRPTLLAQTLTAALAINDESPRSEALVALALRLKEQPVLLAQVLTAALAINDEWLRSKVLVTLVPQFITRHQIRLDLLVLLRKRAGETRARVLTLCSDDKLFAPPFVAPPTLAAIARVIIGVCQEWRWL
jgi:nucleoside phosphorylase